MTKGFSAPKTVGDKLTDFAESGLTTELDKAMCQPCNADECHGCPGFNALGHLENQIGEAGVKFMKELVKEWAEASVEKHS